MTQPIPAPTYRVNAFFRILNEMVDTILAHETKTRGEEFTVQDLIAELEAAEPTQAKQTPTARRQPVKRAAK